jgi:hypothetical protein
MSELDRLVRRLRGLSPRGWAEGDRRAAIRRLAVALAEIGGEGHRLPELPDHAMADVIAVVGADAYAVDPARAAVLVTAALEQTR